MEPSSYRSSYRYAHVTPQKIQIAFRNVRFPADRNMLLSHARLSPVAEYVFEVVEDLPFRTFDNLQDVLSCLGICDHYEETLPYPQRRGE